MTSSFPLSLSQIRRCASGGPSPPRPPRRPSSGRSPPSPVPSSCLRPPPSLVPSSEHRAPADSGGDRDVPERGSCPEAPPRGRGRRRPRCATRAGSCGTGGGRSGGPSSTCATSSSTTSCSPTTRRSPGTAWYVVRRMFLRSEFCCWVGR